MGYADGSCGISSDVMYGNVTKLERRRRSAADIHVPKGSLRSHSLICALKR